MKLSIIIPMKNEEKYIEGCLQSIVNNSYPREKYEIICIDNGSDDRTVELAKKYTKNVYQLPCKTVGSLRNYGAEKAKGKYLAFVDADCVVNGDWMKAASHYFDHDEIVCFGSYPQIPVEATWVQKAWGLNREVKKDIQNIAWLPSMNLFVRKDIFEEVCGFDEKLETCEDVDLCYRIGMKYKIKSDKRIRSTHLGEAKTIKDFIRKELWRGRSNFVGLKHHGVHFKEIPSIIIPLYYLILPFILFMLLYIKGPLFSIVSTIALAALPPLLIAIYITTRAKKYNYVLRASFIYLVYFVVRAIALVR